MPGQRGQMRLAEENPCCGDEQHDQSCDHAPRRPQPARKQKRNVEQHQGVDPAAENGEKVDAVPELAVKRVDQRNPGAERPFERVLVAGLADGRQKEGREKDKIAQDSDDPDCNWSGAVAIFLRQEIPRKPGAKQSLPEGK